MTEQTDARTHFACCSIADSMTRKEYSTKNRAHTIMLMLGDSHASAADSDSTIVPLGYTIVC